MFTLIYNKNDGMIKSITSGTYTKEEIENYGDKSLSFIEIEELPKINTYREEFLIIDNKLTVHKKELSPEIEKEIAIMEINIEINKYKKLLTDSDYKAIKFAEGLLTEEEYIPIRKERQEYRDKINNLEKSLNTLK